jgi:hypothetical protein
VKENDVLCGRGGLSNQHPGNRMFRRVANENKELYQKCDNSSHKHLLVVSIIRAIHHHGGRFVKKHEDSWVEIAHKEACVKTSQALRESSEPSDTSSTTPSSKSKTVIRQKWTSKSEQPRKTRETTPRKVSDGFFQASTTDIVKSSDVEAFSNQKPQAPAVVEYSLADFGGGLLSEDYSAFESLAEFLGGMLSEDDSAFEKENYTEQSSNTFSLIPDEEDHPLPRKQSDYYDLSPLGPNEFLFQSRSEYEDLCRGLADSLCG